MAITTVAFSNSPCSIIRGATGNLGDGANRFLRVGGVGAPQPATDIGPYAADAGAYNNPVFFKKLLEATMRLTGAENAAQLSTATIGFFFYQLGEHWDEVIKANLGPRAKALPAPFFESVTNEFGPQQTPNPNRYSFTILGVVFEDTLGLRAPNYADIQVSVDDTVNNVTTATIKIFHSLTT